MRIYDVDWRTILNSWPEEDIRYLRSMCDEKLAHVPRRRTLICKSEG
jgi:hypothetical protein